MRLEGADFGAGAVLALLPGAPESGSIARRAFARFCSTVRQS